METGRGIGTYHSPRSRRKSVNGGSDPFVRIGIDTGGTFTDFVRFGPRGLAVHKVRSTPEDPSRAILDGLERLDASGGQVDVVHGSTVATNAVLERKGARVALVATRGFEDVLRIGRQTRSELYNIFVSLPRPLVDPDLTFGVTERLDASGAVLVPVDLAGVDAILGALSGRADIAAVCLLHSYANPAHERAVAGRLRAGGLPVCTSHDVLPEYREFERWSTTVVNAYVTPLVDRYLGRLESALAGTGRSLSIMQSNGGSISAGAARTQAVRTVLSGPAAGVVGARAVSHAAGLPRIISFDMGGTSTDVSLIDGDLQTTTDARVGDFPVGLPVIDIHTVGAGGGSIAMVDAGGALRVGPESAGAWPGPACYGVGDELTVTDANLLLGRLDPDCFFGGRMTLDSRRADAAARRLGQRLGLPVSAVAEGGVRVANANMERALRVVSLERGHDPRRFAVCAFGGAGGMHACEIADRLSMTTVIVPRHAGVLSALGMLMADATKDYSASVLRDSATVRPADLNRLFRPLLERAREDLTREGHRSSRQRLTRWLDVRYAGQSYELTVPHASGYRRLFDDMHERRYGYADRRRATEIVNVRVVARGLTDKPALPFKRPKRSFAPAPSGRRRGRFGGRALAVAFYRWDALEPGATARGPAVITSGEATVVVPPRWRFGVDGFGNIIVRANTAAS